MNPLADAHLHRMAISEKWRRTRPLPPDLEDRLAKLPAFLEQRGALLAYLFGSAANRSPESSPRDVDLAILMPGSAESERLDLVEFLGTERFDLVDLERAGPVLRFQIVRDGRLLYARSDEIVNRYELDTLHLYRDTAPMRARQIEYVRERMRSWS